MQQFSYELSSLYQSYHIFQDKMNAGARKAAISVLSFISLLVLQCRCGVVPITLQNLVEKASTAEGTLHNVVIFIALYSTPSFIVRIAIRMFFSSHKIK